MTNETIVMFGAIGLSIVVPACWAWRADQQEFAEERAKKATQKLEPTPGPQPQDTQAQPEDPIPSPVARVTSPRQPSTALLALVALDVYFWKAFAVCILVLMVTVSQQVCSMFRYEKLSSGWIYDRVTHLTLYVDDSGQLQPTGR